MAIDASIPLQGQQLRFPSPGEMLSLQNMVQQYQGQRMQMQQAQREQQRMATLREIFSDPEANDPKTGLPTLQTIGRITRIDPELGTKFAGQVSSLNQQQLAMKAHTSTLEKNQRDMLERRLEYSKKAKEAGVTAYDLAIKNGMPEPKAREAGVKAFRDNILETWNSGIMGADETERDRALSVPFDVAAARAAITTPQQVEQSKAREDQAQRADAALGLREQQVKIQEERMKLSREQEEARRKKEEEKAASGKPLPPTAANKIFDNQQNLRRAERALALIEQYPDAVGFKGYAPDAVLQRTDPQGVDARAAIGDLGSLVIHDRSGAAVTAAEFPRLRPFIPQVTDDAATVKKKLARFVEVYREIANDMSEFYKDSGYEVPELRSSTEGTKSQIKAPESPKSKHGEINTPISSPDGAEWTEQKAHDLYKAGKLTYTQFEEILADVYYRDMQKQKGSK